MNKSSGIDKQKKVLIGVILLLVMVIVVCVCLNRANDKLQEGQLLIKAGDKQLALLTVADIQRLPAVRKQMTIHSSGGSSDHEFTCAELAEILRSVDPGLTSKYNRVITKGIDNYTSGVEMAEVLAKDNVYIAYADGGRPLKTRNGKNGSLRIIIMDDEFGQRFTNYLVSLELEN